LRTAWAWDSVTCWSQEYLISVQILIYIKYKVYIYILYIYLYIYIYYINIFFMYVQCACGMCVHACIYCRPLSRIQTFTTPGTACSRSARTRRSGESKEVRCHHVFDLLIVFSHSFSMSTCFYIYIYLPLLPGDGDETWWKNMSASETPPEDGRNLSVYLICISDHW
jgi:hypothetical protein